MDFQTKGWNS